MNLTRSSVGVEIMPSFLNISPRLAYFSCGRPLARMTASARTTCLRSTTTSHDLPLSAVVFSASTPFCSSTPTIWLASFSDRFV